MHLYLPWKNLRFPHNNVNLAYANVLKVCVFDRLTDTAVWQSATSKYTIVITFIDTVHRQYRIEHQEIRIHLFKLFLVYDMFCNSLSLTKRLEFKRG